MKSTELLEGAQPPTHADIAHAIALLSARAAQLEQDAAGGYLEHWNRNGQTRTRLVVGKKKRYLKPQEVAIVERRIANHRQARAIRAAIAILADCNKDVH